MGRRSSRRLEAWNPRYVEPSLPSTKGGGRRTLFVLRVDVVLGSPSHARSR